MNKALLTIVVAGCLAGCTPSSLLEPTFPAVPPEPPGKTVADRPKRESRPDNRAAVSPKDINDRNARQALRDLEAELEQASEISAKD